MSEKESLKRRTDAAVEAYKSPRVRWVMARSQVKMEIDEKKYRQVVDQIIHDEIERQMIIGAIKEKGPLTIGEISKLIDLEPGIIMQHIIVLRKKGTVSEDVEKDRQYLYKLI